MSHTPGPWAKEPSGRFVYADAVSKNGEEYDLIIAEIDPDAQLLLNESEMQANATLITSAPDMAAELERLRAVNAQLLEALKEIAKGEGAFSLDQLTFANNTVENMKEIAEVAIEAAS